MTRRASGHADPWAGLAPAHAGAHRARPQRRQPADRARSSRFQLAHAQARDAVHRAARRRRRWPRDAAGAGLADAARAQRRAPTAPTYLQRPDLGRRLDDASRAAPAAQRRRRGRLDLALVVADGLSALAVERHAAAAARGAAAHAGGAAGRSAPVVVVEQGRVALGDEIGELLGARLVVVLIGERPGPAARPTAWASTSPGRRAPAAPTPSATASPTSGPRAWRSTEAARRARLAAATRRGSAGSAAWR